MSVYYQYGTSDSGETSGLTGYYYPLYVTSEEAAAKGVDGKYHTHTFSGLSNHIFYMPMNTASVHAASSAPTGGYSRETYQEHTGFTLDDEDQTLQYSTSSTAANRITITSAAVSKTAQTIQPIDELTNIESSRAEDLIPLQIRESAAKLTNLLEDYYDYLNSDSQTSNISNRILTEHDIDKVSSQYLDSIQKEIAKSVPNARTLDRVNLYKRISKYYDIRGSKESLLVFFRIFFDETVDVFYPKDLLFKPSDGKWNPTEPTPLNEINVYSLKNGSFGLNDKNDNILYYKDDTLLAEGQITSIEPLETTSSLAADSKLVFSIDTSKANTYNLPDPTQPESANNIGSIATNEGYIGTFRGGGSGSRPTFDPEQGLVFDGRSTGTNPSTSANVVFDQNPRASYFANDPRPNNLTLLARVNFSDISSGRSPVQFWNRSTVPWYAPIGSKTVAEGGVARIQNSTGGAGTAYIELRPQYKDNTPRLSHYISRFGYWYGGKSFAATGTQVIPENEPCTIAISTTRDPDATPQTGGTGTIKTSVNGQAFETIWNDAEWGDSSTFAIKDFFRTTEGAHYSVAGFTKLQSGSSDVTYNGKPVYTTSTTPTNASATATSAHVDANTSGYMIRFEVDTLFENSVQYNSTYYDDGTAPSGPGHPLATLAIPNNKTKGDFWGSWVMYGVTTGTLADAAVIDLGDNLGNATIRPYLRWFDIGYNVVMYRKDFIDVDGTRLSTHHPWLGARTPALLTDLGYIKYGCGRGFQLNNGDVRTSGARQHGPNQGSSSRNTFFDCLRDHGRSIFFNDSGHQYTARFGPERNFRKSKLVDNLIWHAVVYQHGAEGFGNNNVSTAGFDTKWNPYFEYGGIPTSPYFDGNKKIGWVTSAEILPAGINSDGSMDNWFRGYKMQLGFGRWHDEFQGSINNVQLYTKNLTDTELSNIHNNVKLDNYDRYKLGISVNDDFPILRANKILDKSGEYELTNIDGQPVDGFWTYEKEDFGATINSMKIAFSGGGTSSINWGDGSNPVAFSSNSTLAKTLSRVAAENGSYLNDKGRASDVSKVQDSNYWQEYSYEIRSGLNINEWRNEYLKLVHPAGLKLFAAFLIQVSRSNKWTGQSDWSESIVNTQTDSQLTKWMKYLIPSWKDNTSTESGFHLPKFQPGFLSFAPKVTLFLEALLGYDGMSPVVNSSTGEKGFRSYREDSDKLRRFLQVIIRYFMENTNTRDSIVLDTYLKDQKFIDGQQRSGDYSFLSSNELNNSSSLVIPKSSHETNLLSRVLPWSESTAIYQGPAEYVFRGVDITNSINAAQTDIRYALSAAGEVPFGANHVNMKKLNNGVAYGYGYADVRTQGGRGSNPASGIGYWGMGRLISNSFANSNANTQLGRAAATLTSAASGSDHIITMTIDADQVSTLGSHSSPGSQAQALRILGLRSGLRYKLSGEFRISANTSNADSITARVDFSDGNHQFEGVASTSVTSGTNSFTAFELDNLVYNENIDGNTINVNNFIDLELYGIKSTNITGSFSAEFKNIRLDVYAMKGGYSPYQWTDENAGVPADTSSTSQDRTYGPYRNSTDVDSAGNVIGDYTKFAWDNDGGTDIEASRQKVVDPFGNTNVCWKSTNLDRLREAEGGFRSPKMEIKPTESYRFSIWCKKTDRGFVHQNTSDYNGTVYFGVYPYVAYSEWTSPVTLADANNPSSDTGYTSNNTYFWYGDLPRNDEWFLIVGYLCKRSSTSDQAEVIGAGLYDTKGVFYDPLKSATNTWMDSDGKGGVDFLRNFRFLDQANIRKHTGDAASTDYAIAQLRARYYYNSDLPDAGLGELDKTGNQGDYVTWFGPRIDLINGEEPTIDELINPRLDSNTLYGYHKRPERKAIKKFNNFQSNVQHPRKNKVVVETSVADVFARLKENYNKELKFLDSADIGPYYNTTISDVTTITSEAIPTSEDYIATGSSGTTSDSSSDTGDGGGGGSYTPPSEGGY